MRACNKVSELNRRTFSRTGLVKNFKKVGEIDRNPTKVIIRRVGSSAGREYGLRSIEVIVQN